MHAIQLLEVVPHHEGIWSARIMAAVSRKLVELESGERGAGTKSTAVEDKFGLLEVPGLEGLTPDVPISRRLRNVKVVMPDEPHGIVWCSLEVWELDRRCVRSFEYDVLRCERKEIASLRLCTHQT